MAGIRICLLILFLSFFFSSPSSAKAPIKIAVWDLAPRNIQESYTQELTAILASEVSKTGKYEVFSQDNFKTLLNWEGQRMQLGGCTDSKCLTILGQMEISKLISGSVGKIGNTYSISLSLFDTQQARADKSVSEFCRTEDDLIPLVQQAARKLLGEPMETPVASTVTPQKVRSIQTSSLPPPQAGTGGGKNRWLTNPPSLDYLTKLPSDSLLIIVKDDSSTKTLGSLIGLANKLGDWGLTLGTGAGDASAGKKYMQGLGAKVNIVPFEKSRFAITATLGGHINGGIVPKNEALPHVEAGRLRVLAVMDYE